MGLPFSSLASKELGSCHYHPYNKKKAELIEEQQVFLDPSENWGQGQNTTQTTREKDRQIQRVAASWSRRPGRKLGQEKSIDNWRIAGGSVWTSLRVNKISGGPILGETSILFWVLPQGALPGSHSRGQGGVVGEDTLVPLAQGGEVAVLRYAQSTLFRPVLKVHCLIRA